MTIKIEIECESTQQALLHLDSIINEMWLKKKEIESVKADGECAWEDNNCYGTHEVVVTNNDYDNESDDNTSFSFLRATSLKKRFLRFMCKFFIVKLQD